MNSPCSTHTSQVHVFHQASFDADHPFIDQIEWFGLMALIGVVRLFAGSSWRPTEIGLTGFHLLHRSTRERFPDTCLQPAQRYGYINLDSALLSLPPAFHETDAFSPPHRKPTTDFADSLRLVLRAYIQDSDLRIQFAAELWNISERSLQRKLTEAGTHYSEVRDRTLFDAASDLLRDPDLKVTDVAHLLGYSDSAHFTRAFRRIASVTP